MDAYVKKRVRNALFCTFFAGSALLAGCDNRETAIRSYTAPKEAAPVTTTAPTTAVAPVADAGQALPLNWTLPAGWELDPQPRPMRVATVHVDANGKHGELIVTRFRAGGFGGLLDNLNRWRQQVGLEPLKDEAAATPENTTVGGAPARVYDFTGPAADGNPPRRNRVVMAETGGGDVWFFRLVGPADLVESQKGPFDSLLQSVSFQEQVQEQKVKLH